ncbi:Integral membrane protein [Aurantiacibacter gangjinensis]|nr:Integral membrane protein [Aurantiacibacter gangjinensis]
MLAAIIALCAFAALAVQTTLGDGSILQNLGAMLRYFTIWSNVAACLVMAWIALGGQPPRAVMAALTTAITVVGVVYWGLLAATHDPVGLDRITNQFHHTFVPLATVAWWLAFTPPNPRVWSVVPAIMVPPLAYGAFAFVHGELTGFYAYFFLDLPAQGAAGFIIANIVLALFFALVGAGLVSGKNALARRRGITASLHP